jgi:aspartate/methionine/tyrosine aminotransferase
LNSAVLIEEPTYEPILSRSRAIFWRQIKRFPRSFDNGYRVDVGELARQITPRTRLIVLTNLHNLAVF